MAVRIQTEDFDIAAEVLNLRGGNAKIGAIACFIGLVRDINDDATVAEMTLEHYPAMTQKALSGIVEEANQRWELIDVSVVHRVGTLKPTDQIVLVLVASAHRSAAFSACEFIVDYLKTRAPFWKKEQTDKGTRWVEARDSDDDAAQRWH
ncbi:MAG TPA: molybdopterin synthase catalytic subunit MoaE [Burkholderiales bacterium]|nr:molybdopterin synthase catalytic subunit MoaE [Burkholderiales bacterium]